MTTVIDNGWYWQRSLAASLVALVAYPSIASAATPVDGRYDCVLMGQGACSDEGICLGNRISPDDRNVRLIVDFGGKMASLNNIPGRLVTEASATIVRWHLSTIEDARVDIYPTDRDPILQLGPVRGGGATAAFRCRKRT